LKENRVTNGNICGYKEWEGKGKKGKPAVLLVASKFDSGEG